MKTLKSLSAILLLLSSTPVAMASLYVGTWKNITFGSTGALKIDLNLSKTQINGSLELDGPVFGMGDPPAIPFSAPLDPDGSTSFKVKDTTIGDLAFTFESDGDLSLKITSIPGGFLSKCTVAGKFDLKLETFKGTYLVYDSDGESYANGQLEAHVRKAPVIGAPRQVKTKGKTAQVAAKVTSNTKITSFTATATAGAKATVTGKGPYKITVRKINAAQTTLTLTAKNADGFKSIRLVKVLKSASAVLIDP